MEISHPRLIMWHDNILPVNTKRALNLLSKENWLKRTKWYLAGGTALAMQVGHRQSMDLDFFIKAENFSIGNLLKHLKKKQWTADIVREGTVYGRLAGAKISFIAYPFFDAEEYPIWYGAVRVLSPADIAVMKIIAISQRGRKRDFIDLYWHLQNKEPLIKVLQRLPAQYPIVNHNYHHIIKSLVYFADAENDPMPKIFFNATWEGIKKYLEREVPKTAKELLGLK